MNGAFKGLNQSDVYITSYISKKQWQVASGSFGNLGISKVEAASGSSTYDSLRVGYYEGSIPNSGSFSGSFDLNLQSTLTLQGGRRIPTDSILAYFVPRDCFGETIEPGTFRLDSDLFAAYDREGLILLDKAEKVFKKDYELKTGEVSGTPIAEIVTEYSVVPGQQYSFSVKVPPDGTWESIKPLLCFILEGLQGTDKYVLTGEELTERRNGGETIDISFTPYSNVIRFTWREDSSRKGQKLADVTVQKVVGTKDKVLGDIVYNQGLILLDKAKANPVKESLSWTSIKTINTWNTRCVVKDLEYNYSYNRTITGENQELLGTSEFTPYITAVGLYNRSGELMAVAKLSKPIRKNDNIDMTFKVNIDIS